MSDREKIRENFLKVNNINNSNIELLPADASFRNYYRIKEGKNSFILMDAPPDKEPNTGIFVKVSEFLNDNGFSAPKIIKADLKKGFLLLEDLGNNSFNKILEEDNSKGELLYSYAIDVLLKLHSISVPDAILPYYTDDLILKELNRFIEWYIPVLNGEVISKKLQEEYEVVWKHLLQYARQIPETTVLRDYHVDNLMWLEDRENIRKVGLLDFQDAIVGSPVYDIVSLLQDARREVSEEITQAMITKYLTAKPDILRKDFLASYSILGAQRNLRIIGNFARKSVRDKNSNYLKFLPRVWSNIEKNLKHPLLFPLKAWLDKVISPQVRGNREKASF
ncbi:MAG: aminoglycoside phosphotransferase family protein [Alphaproteobacteria bacterium]